MTSSKTSVIQGAAALPVMAIPTVKKAAEMDPDLLMKKKFRAKCQFRALFRLVLANLYWLMEDVEQYEGLDDVKRRVQQAVRGKTKKKQLLSIQDKAILNKNANERTDSEKKYLYRIIGGLKCFKRYPNHVKKKLAAVTYFTYYSPNRVIVRQHQEAHALYFIVTGEVTVSHLVYDELLQKQISVELGVMRAGDMFGEVSLLHNIPRTATVTSASKDRDSITFKPQINFNWLSENQPLDNLIKLTPGHCELLVLMKEDFKNVLQASIQKSWDEVRRAMSAFTYFDSLDEVALREGCIVAKMKSYSIGETILGDGIGVPNFVYFVLSGKCQMIENIQVTVRRHLHHIYYTLYDPYVEKEDSDKDFDEKYFRAYKNLVGSQTDQSGSLNPSGILKDPRESDTSDILEESQRSKKSESAIITGEEVKGEKSGNQEDPDIAVSDVAARATSTSRGSIRLSTFETRSHMPSVVFQQTDEQRKLSIRMSVGSNKIVPPNTKTVFMQVCFFNPGASFGFGENMRDRRIIASTPVNCMLMPKIWLLQRNTANIWSRIQYYLEKKIPTKKMLFKEFVEQRKWMAFKDQLVDDVVARHNTVNWTSKHDIPYSIRMEEIKDGVIT